MCQQSSISAAPVASEQPPQLRRLTVAYPSGRKFDVVGYFFLAPLLDWLLPSVWQSKTAVMILDARAVVSLAGLEVYSPRNNPAMPPDLAQWCRENPQWAREPLCAAN